MYFGKLLEIVGDEPVFETGLLLVGETDPDNVRQQLSRWTSAGRLIQLRRGVYSLAPPYQKTKPHPFVVANRLVRGSYVSLQAALAYYELIPEYTPITTSVTTGRPGQWETPLGVFAFHHIQPSWLRGYQRIETSPRQSAFVATPEKALLDLLNLVPHADAPPYLKELRLQNLERLNFESLDELVRTAHRPKLDRVVKHLKKLARQEQAEFVTV